MKPESFAAFADAVASRLEKGALVYGDLSFERRSVELAGEVLEELEDVAGWAFVLWVRLRRLRPVLARIDEDRLAAGRERTGTGDRS